MPDITPPVAPAVTNSGNVASSASLNNLVAVPVAVTDASTAIQDLTRSIQAMATVVAAPDASNITLTTALGNLTVSLTQLASNQQQQALQQLLNALGSGKPLTITLQPETPQQSQQAVLLIPQNISVDPASQTAAPATSPTALPPLTAGTVLTAIVLPSASDNALPVSINNAGLANLSLPTAPAIPANSALGQSGPVILPLPLDGATPNPSTPTSTITGGAQPAPTLSTPAPPILNAAPIATNSPATVPTNLAENLSSTPAAAQTAPALGAPAELPTNSAATPSATLSTTPPPALLAGQQINLKIDAISLPSSPTPLPVLDPNQILGTVTGKGVNGELIVQSGNTTLFVRTPVDAPVGTNLVLTAVPVKADIPVTLSDVTNQGFAGLQQMLTALAQIDPALAQQIINQAIPQPAAQLPGTLLFFMNVLQQGNMQSWLGTAATDKLVRAGKQEIVAQMAKEFLAANATQTTRDATVGEWRAHTIPLYLDHQINTISLYVHNDPQQGQHQTGAKTTPNKVRFLIDLRMSRLGALQLDGLAQPKKLDIIVRSEHALPSALPQDLRNIYIKTLDAMNYAGGLSFQTGRKNWLVMLNKGISREI